MVGVWPAPWLSSKTAYYYLTLLAVRRRRSLLLWRAALLALRLRAARGARLAAARRGDRHRRARQQWAAFALAGLAAGLAGALYAFSKGSISPETLAHPALGGRPGDGAAGRHPDPHRPGLGRGALHLAAGRGRAQHRLLARGDRRRRSSRWCSPSRRASPACRCGWQARERMSRARGHGARASPSAACRPSRDVSFAVAAGELLALIGPNGAGKTTCFNMLNGQLAARRGRDALRGPRIAGLRAAQRSGGSASGRTFQITATFGSMTVRENVQMALLSHHRRLALAAVSLGTRLRDEADALLEQVGMRDAGRAALRGARLRRPEARRARDGAGQRARGCC